MTEEHHYAKHRIERGTSSIEIVTSGQPKLTVPASCRFRRDLTIEPDKVKVAGKAGDSFERKLFQELKVEDWRSPRVISRPKGCQVEIRQFDDHTNLISVKFSIPKIDEINSHDADNIVLESQEGRQARIAMRYTREE